MHTSRRSPRARGFSLLMSVFTMAVLVGVVFGIQLVAPSVIAQSQGAAVGNTNVSPDTTGQGRITDNIPTTQARDNRGRLYDVRYACDQYVSVPLTGTVDSNEYVKSLEQNCVAGFIYKVHENRLGISVIPEAQEGTQCPLYPPTPTVACTTGTDPRDFYSNCTLTGSVPPKCQVKYCIGTEECQSAGDVAPGESLGLANRRARAVSATLAAAPPERRLSIMDDAHVPLPQQDALSRAYDLQQVAQNGLDGFAAQRADLAEQIKNYAGCDVYTCTQEVQSLKQQDADLAAQQALLAARLNDLRNDAVSMLSGEPIARQIQPQSPATVAAVPGQGSSTFKPWTPGLTQGFDTAFAPSEDLNIPGPAQADTGNDTGISAWGCSAQDGIQWLCSKVAEGATYASCALTGFGCASDTSGSAVAGEAPLVLVGQQSLAPLATSDWSEKLNLTPVPVTAVTSTPLPPVIPAEFQAVQSLAGGTSLTKQLAELGTYTERKAIVEQYFANELSGYSGTKSQNARLVDLVRQYGTTVVPTPTPRPSIPVETIPVPVPISDTPSVDVGRIQTAAQSYTGPSIVEFCKAAGYTCSASSQERKDLAALVGIQGYEPTQAGNTALLEALRKQYGR